jgi:hypothetical protein
MSGENRDKKQETAAYRNREIDAGNMGMRTPVP